jgi:PPOX class probable F420-dependent enzyme
MSIADEKYVSVATFRRTGEAVATATWIVALDDGRLGLWTSSAAGKAKRLRNSPRLTLQPSDARGRVRVGSDVVEGTAALVTSGAEFDEIQSKVRAKYGFGVPMSRLFNKIGHLGKGSYPVGDLGVVVTLNP